MPLTTEPTPVATEASDVDIHRADPGEARRTFWVVLVALALAIGVSLLMQRELASIRGWLEAGETEFATQRFLILARVALGTLALVGVIAGLIVARGALAVIREQRYPHTKARLLHDRPIRRGAAARRMGQWGLALAAGFFIVAIGGAILGWLRIANFSVG